MGGQSSSQTQTSQSQSGTTAPWQPTQGLLNNIIGGLGSQYSSTAPTSAENSAINTLQQNAAATPNYGTQATNLTNQLFTGGPDLTGGVNNAYQTYQNQISPYANGQNLDPTQAPGMQQVLQTIQSDVGNSVNGMFAGAGRDMSGANQQALARGISQGEAQPLLDQYNQNVQNQLGAASSLYGAGNTTAGMLSGLNQTSLGNQIQGLTTAAQINPLMNNSANATLQAGQVARGLPLNNLGQLENLILPIAGMGSQTTGQSSGTSNTTNQASPMQEAMGWTSAFGNLFGGSGGGASSNFLKMISDRRAKHDIEVIGKLYDGTPVYRFRYIGHPAMQIGLMADDVEKYAPESIGEVGGFKAVDYEMATDRAVKTGTR